MDEDALGPRKAVLGQRANATDGAGSLERSRRYRGGAYALTRLPV